LKLDALANFCLHYRHPTQNQLKYQISLSVICIYPTPHIVNTSF